jgi:hypothetical protein
MRYYFNPARTMIAANDNDPPFEPPSITPMWVEFSGTDGDIVLIEKAASGLIEGEKPQTADKLSAQFDLWGIIPQARECLLALREGREIWPSNGWASRKTQHVTSTAIETVASAASRVFLIGDESRLGSALATLQSNGMSFRATWRQGFCRIPGTVQYAVTLFVRSGPLVITPAAAALT